MKYEPAEQLVVAVESKLTALDQLTADYSSLTAEIESLKQQRCDVLSGDLPESKKVTALQKIDLTAEVKQSDLTKLKCEIRDAMEWVVSATVDAHKELCELRDGILLDRKQRIRADLEKLFPAKVIDLMSSLINQAFMVKEVWAEFFVIMRTKPAEAVRVSRKMRPLLEHLKAPEKPLSVPAIESHPVLDEVSRPQSQVMGALV